MTAPARLAVLLLTLALPLLLQGATLPHTHAGGDGGFFNAEHDLTLLATIGTLAADVAAAPSVTFVVVATALAFVARQRGAASPPRSADSRAPPAR